MTMLVMLIHTPPHAASSIIYRFYIMEIRKIQKPKNKIFDKNIKILEMQQQQPLQSKYRAKNSNYIFKESKVS